MEKICNNICLKNEVKITTSYPISYSTINKEKIEKDCIDAINEASDHKKISNYLLISDIYDKILLEDENVKQIIEKMKLVYHKEITSLDLFTDEEVIILINMGLSNHIQKICDLAEIQGSHNLDAEEFIDKYKYEISVGYNLIDRLDKIRNSDTDNKYSYFYLVLDRSINFLEYSQNKYNVRYL